MSFVLAAVCAAKWLPVSQIVEVQTRRPESTDRLHPAREVVVEVSAPQRPTLRTGEHERIGPGVDIGHQVLDDLATDDGRDGNRPYSSDKSLWTATLPPPTCDPTYARGNTAIVRAADVTAACISWTDVMLNLQPGHGASRRYVARPQMITTSSAMISNDQIG
jgi:hypothetical protein